MLLLHNWVEAITVQIINKFWTLFYKYVVSGGDDNDHRRVDDKQFYLWARDLFLQMIALFCIVEESLNHRDISDTVSILA